MTEAEIRAEERRRCVEEMNLFATLWVDRMIERFPTMNPDIYKATGWQIMVAAAALLPPPQATLGEGNEHTR